MAVTLGTSLAGLLFADGLTAVLTGVAVGSVMLEVAHLTDRLLGGRPSDPYTVGAVAVIVLFGVLAAAHALTQSPGGQPLAADQRTEPAQPGAGKASR